MVATFFNLRLAPPAVLGINHEPPTPIATTQPNFSKVGERALLMT